MADLILSRGEQAINAMIARLRPPDDLTTLPTELQDLAAELGTIEVDEYPLRQGDGARVRVFPFDEKVTPMGVKVVRRELVVKLDLLRAPVPDDVAVNKGIDPLYLWCVTRLVTDRTLGGLVDWLEERSRAWGGKEAEQPHGKLLLEFAVVYRTLASNPDRRA
jgi:hypothetical protein